MIAIKSSGSQLTRKVRTQKRGTMKSTKLVVASLILSCSCVQAANVKVHCGGKGQFTSISSALKTLDPSLSNAVTVRGKCHENVLIQGFDRLTLISTTSAQIQDASGGKSLVVDIEDSRRVTLQGFTVTGGLGVQCFTSSVCYLTGNTVQSSMGDGVGVFSASSAYLSGNVIQNNAGRGLALNTGSTVFSFTDTFQGNTDSGIRVLASHLYAVSSAVKNNGSDGEAGVVGRENSTLRFDSCTISGNVFDGVLLGGSAEARFAGSDVVTGNGASGVNVGDLSFTLFQGATVTGNLGGTDVLCNPQFSATRGALTDIGGGTTNCVEPGGVGKRR
jgi:Right handed beta helix region